MEIKIHEQDGVLTIALEGRLDTLTSSLLTETLTNKITDDSASVILDLKQLNYISSAGLRLLLQFHKKLNESGSGSFVITNVKEEVKDIFEITGLNTVLKIEY